MAVKLSGGEGAGGGGWYCLTRLRSSISVSWDPHLQVQIGQPHSGRSPLLFLVTAATVEVCLQLASISRVNIGQPLQKGWADVHPTMSAQRRHRLREIRLSTYPNYSMTSICLSAQRRQHQGDVGPTFGRCWTDVSLPTICQPHGQLFTNFC